MAPIANAGPEVAQVVETGAKPTQSHRTKHAFLTALSQLAQTGSTLLVGMLVTPVIVGGLGQTNYGIWVIILQATNYLSLVDVGNATILKYQLAAQQHLTDDQSKRRLVAAALLGQATTLPLFFLLLWALVDIAPTYLFGASGVSADLRWCIGIVGFTFLLTRLAALLSFALFGSNRDYHSTLRRTAVILLVAGLDVAVMLKGGGLFGLSINKLVGGFVAVFVTLMAVRSALPWFGVATPTREEYVSTLRGNLYYLMSQWGSILSESVDVVLVGWALGSAPAAAFVLTSSLSRVTILTISGMLTAGTPGLADLFGRGRFQELKTVRAQALVVAFLVFSVFGPAILIHNASFVSLWVGDEKYSGHGITTAGILFFMVLVISRFQQQLAYACQLFKETIGLSLLSGAAGFVAALVGLRYAGPPGMLIGLGIGRLMSIQATSRVLKTVLDRGSESKTPRPWRSFLTLCVLLGAGSVAAGSVHANNWLMLAVLGAGTAVLSGGVYWFAGMNRQEREAIVRRFGPLLGRRRRSLPAD